MFKHKFHNFISWILLFIVVQHLRIGKKWSAFRCLSRRLLSVEWSLYEGEFPTCIKLDSYPLVQKIRIVFKNGIMTGINTSNTLRIKKWNSIDEVAQPKKALKREKEMHGWNNKNNEPVCFIFYYMKLHVKLWIMSIILYINRHNWYQCWYWNAKREWKLYWKRYWYDWRNEWIDQR